MAGTLKCDTIVNSAGTGAPSFTYGISGTTPTQQRFTSGSAQTYTTPANVKYLKVRMVGGGAGGHGGGTTNGTAPTAGTATTFGSSLLTANGGNFSTGNVGSYAPAAGGTATINSPAYGTAITGGSSNANGFFVGTAMQFCGAPGGVNPLGGNGGGGGNGNAGSAGAANTGAGGGGGGQNSGTNPAGGTGGGAGGYIEAFIPSPSATYTYTVGSGGSAGAAGTGGFAGGAGAAGYIEVTEYYA